MKTKIVLPLICSGALALGVSSNAVAGHNPVTGLLNGTAKVVTSVGQGGVTIVKGVGYGTGQVLRGVGHGVCTAVVGVGKGTAKVVKTTTKVVTGS